MTPPARIADPVHGTIELTPVEAEVVGSRAFQRLRNVKQLGLSHLVFPSADYSRFAHCLGVCHVTGRVLGALQGEGQVRLDAGEEQLYRLAALLHDVGHYPFSHATEHAVADHYLAAAYLEPAGEPPAPAPPAPAPLAPPAPAVAPYLYHEQVGRELVLGDPELPGILARHGQDPAEVAAVFTRQDPPRFANLISSDLDADRIDYLMRTAVYTGLPYGRVDLPHLLSQLRVDAADRICLTPRGVRTAEHVLLGRYFEYQQVSFNPTVVAMEWLLQAVVADLLATGMLDLSGPTVRRLIRAGRWEALDDGFVWRLVRELEASTGDERARDRAAALLGRQVPRLVGASEDFAPRGLRDERAFGLRRRIAREEVAKLGERYGVPPHRWHVWAPAGMPLTKIGSQVPYSSALEAAADRDRYEQSVRVLEEDGRSVPIAEYRSSLLQILADHALYAVRVYLLSDDDDLVDQVRGDLRGLL
jgi:HD superfamily phosphohydrolase